ASGKGKGDVAEELATTTTREPGTPAGHHGAPAAKATTKAPGFLEVHTPEPQLKTLDDDAPADTASLAKAGKGGAAIAANPAPQQGQAPAGPPRDNVADGAYDAEKNAKLDEWAQVQHRQLLQLVRDGKCVEAGKIGSEIAARAPEYYAAHVENDRAARGCK